MERIEKAILALPEDLRNLDDTELDAEQVLADAQFNLAHRRSDEIRNARSLLRLRAEFVEAASLGAEVPASEDTELDLARAKRDKLRAEYIAARSKVAELEHAERMATIGAASAEPLVTQGIDIQSTGPVVYKSELRSFEVPTTIPDLAKALASISKMAETVLDAFFDQKPKVSGGF